MITTDYRLFSCDSNDVAATDGVPTTSRQRAMSVLTRSPD